VARRDPIFAALAVLTVLVVAGAGGYAIVRAALPGSGVLASSEAPDGGLRCLVVEHRPGWFGSAPYDYDFTLFDAASGAPLPGPPGHHRSPSDLSDAGGFTFEWSGAGVAVILSTGERIQGQAVGGSQEWR
jgi:hypothetical protein